VPIRAEPVLCAAWGLSLAVVLAVARGWPPEPRYLALLGVAVLPMLGQILRRRFLPPLVQAVPLLGAQIAIAMDAPAVDPSPLLLLWLAANVAIGSSARWAAAVTAMCVVFVVVNDVLAGPIGALQWTVGMVMAAEVGWVVGKQQRTLDELTRAQAELAERAAVEERRRVAREVHDVVAHTLAVTMLHLTGARLALSEGDATEAEAGLLEAERLGRESLVGLRRTVGLLTHDEAATDLPAPDLTRVDELVREYAAGGAEVELDLAVRHPVPEDVGLAAYRIVQESLANAVRHAPGAPVRVHVQSADGELSITVADGGPGRGNRSVGRGQGLAGMAERATLLGGWCHAGPRPDMTGWAVEAALPLHADPDGPLRCPLRRGSHGGELS
jgi:signal transduction histidine kinase